ncbi:MAG: hypothetical protein Kow001_08010 [Acidobacteriota bacterium]
MGSAGAFESEKCDDWMVREEVVPSSPDFREAVEPGALRRACASNVEALERFFTERGLPFQRELLRRNGRSFCHILYEPTLPGFRIAAETDPVRTLLVDYDATRFVTRGSEELGDSLDVLRAILQSMENPPPVTMTLNHSLHAAYHASARSRHFGAEARLVNLAPSPVLRPYNPWAQDFVKSGRVGGELRGLVPRRLYEGSSENGPVYELLLDQIAAGMAGFARSRLSWEGGDLMAVRDPGHPERLLLVHGDAARPYLGDLTPAEYAYVLKLEFGADATLDLSGLAAHVDFAVNFLAGSKVALLARPLTGNHNLAREALASLIGRFNGSPHAELAELRSLLAAREHASASELRRALRRALDARPAWVLPPVDDALSEAAGSLTLFEVNRLLAGDPERAREQVFRGWSRLSGSQIIDAHLALVASQLHGSSSDLRKRLEHAGRTLERLGFQVVEVPTIQVDPDLGIQWAGLSHVNFVNLEGKIFLPRFGFGAEEDALFDRLQDSLPAGYTVVPVYAQHLLLHNGGLHCMFGIIR